MTFLKIILTYFFILTLAVGTASADVSNTPVITTSCSTNPIVEGNVTDTNVTCSVTLNVAPNKSNISLNIFAVDVSASNGTDYVAPTQTLTFVQNTDTSKEYNITINGDVSYESDEEFVIRVTNNGTNPSQYFTLPSDYTVVITNDDPTPNVVLSISNTSIEEGDSNTTLMNFPINLTAPTTTDVTVTYRFDDITTDLNDTNMTNGSTYSFIIPSGTAAGLYAAQLLGVKGDTDIESDETFSITLLNTTEGGIDSAAATATGTITNDDGTGGTPVVILSYNPGTVDAVDAYVPTASSPFYEQVIKTKVAGQTNLTLDAVYLGNDPTNYIPTVYTQADMPVIMYLYDPVTNVQTKLYEQNSPNTPLAAVIQSNSVSATTPLFTMPATATKESYVLMKYLDYEALSLEPGAPNCLAHSSTGAFAVPGLPSCVASDVQYLDAFHQEAFDRCKVQHGEPCKPSFHGHSGGGDPNYPGYDPTYDHKYGCYECTIGATPMIRSVDNFAIRPERLTVTSTNANMPNLLRSAQDYNTTINAYNYGTTTNTQDYTITNANTEFTIALTKYNRNDVVTPSMFGNASFAATGFDMTNGLSTKSGVSGEVAGLSFDDVGKINISIQDRTWAAVDNDDTPMTCDPNGTYVCGDMNVTFIPDSFDFHELELTNNDGNESSFTYLANDLSQMAGRIETTIRALNKNLAVTKNFASFPLWENNVTVTPVVTKSTYIYPDANETIIDNLAIGFTQGTKAIDWNENNASQYLRFNFQRDVDTAVNPFDVNGSDLNISVTSTYVDGASSVDISGVKNASADGNTTFLYGRTHAPRHRFANNTHQRVFIYYEAYCNGSGCDKSLLPDGSSSNYTDDPRWFINTKHVSTFGTAGTVTQKNASLVTVDTGYEPSGNHQDSVFISYNNAKGTPYKTTMQNAASSWLIYNKYNASATKNEFDVEFSGGGNDWVGMHDTNTTTKRSGTDVTNRRSMW